MSPRLAAYLTLEKAMLLLDEVDIVLANRVRDAMDPLWHTLTGEEHESLNSRQLSSGDRVVDGHKAQ